MRRSEYTPKVHPNCDIEYDHGVVMILCTRWKADYVFQIGIASVGHGGIVLTEHELNAGPVPDVAGLAIYAALASNPAGSPLARICEHPAFPEALEATIRTLREKPS